MLHAASLCRMLTRKRKHRSGPCRPLSAQNACRAQLSASAPRCHGTAGRSQGSSNRGVVTPRPRPRSCLSSLTTGAPNTSAHVGIGEGLIRTKPARAAVTAKLVEVVGAGDTAERSTTRLRSDRKSRIRKPGQGRPFFVPGKRKQPAGWGVALKSALGQHNAVAGEALIELHATNHAAWPCGSSRAPGSTPGARRVAVGLLGLQAANRRGLGRIEQGGADRPQGGSLKYRCLGYRNLPRSPCPAIWAAGACSSRSAGGEQNVARSSKG